MGLKQCRRCRSGYEVDVEAGHQFCGFCGARVMKIHVETLTTSGPFYLDSNEPIRIMIRITNQGVADASLDLIEIE